MDRAGYSINDHKADVYCSKINDMEDVPFESDKELLLQLVKIGMPFGKYKGTILCNLPVSYLEWFRSKGFPKGRLGILLETMYEIRINGLEGLLTPLK